MAMVVREAVINAILHGNKQDPAKQVQVELELNEEALGSQIADEGPGLDPDSASRPAGAGEYSAQFGARDIPDEGHHG